MGGAWAIFRVLNMKLVITLFSWSIIMTSREVHIEEKKLSFILRFLIVIIRPIGNCKDRKWKRKDTSGKDVNFLGPKFPGIHPHLELVTHSRGCRWWYYWSYLGLFRAIDSSEKGVLQEILVPFFDVNQILLLNHLYLPTHYYQAQGQASLYLFLSFSFPQLRVEHQS